MPCPPIKLKAPIQLLLILLIGLGMLCRLTNLDHKLYWYDEAFTSLRAAGYTEAEIVAHFADSAVVPATELQQYLHPPINRTTDRTAGHTANQIAEPTDRTLSDTLHSLAVEDTQHPPLYYTIAHFWSRWVGSSIADLRLLAALLSLLGLPAMYWLGQELWLRLGNSPTALPVWIGVALLAISPFQLTYGQESRQYSLWSTLTLVMTAALLRALRRSTWRNWGLYALATAASLYTFLFTALVCLAHAIYLCSGYAHQSDRKQYLQSILAFLLATLTAGLLFLPWATVLWQQLDQAQTVTQWTHYTRTPIELVTSWLQTIGRVFYDRQTLLDRAVQVGVIAIVGYAYYWLVRKAPQPVGRLVLSLTLVPVLPLMLADLTVGGMRSTVPRYFIPTLLGIQLAVTYLFGSKLSNPTARPQLWRGLFGLLCSASLVANWTNLQAPTWWQKDHNQANPEIAELLHQTPQSVLISDAETGDLLSLAHNLTPDTKLLIRPRCYTCQAQWPDRFDTQLLSLAPPDAVLYLFHPRNSKDWQQSLSQPNYEFELIPLRTKEANNKLLWRIVKK